MIILSPGSLNLIAVPLTTDDADDFTQLNEKFIKARRDYEALLETSMSHPPQHNYQQYAMRPVQQAYPPPAGTYPPQGQDPQRFYTPGAQGSTSPPYLITCARI